MPPSLRLRSTANPAQPSSRRRDARKHTSYKEETSDSDDLEPYLSRHVVETPSSRSLRRKAGVCAGPRQSGKRKLSGQCPEPPIGTKKAKFGHVEGDMKRGDSTGAPVHPPAMAIPWATLPYQVLVAIFDYASRPLANDTNTPSPSITWLLRAALICKTFTEPALSALYYSPPLSPPNRAQSLLDHLATQNEQSIINYRAKIKYLDVEASGTLLRKFAGQDPIDLGTLVSFTPQLRGIHIYRLADDLKFVTGRRFAGKAAYKESLFTELQENQIMLQKWTWNQMLARQTASLADLREVHTLTSYQTIRDISFVNYESGPLEKGRRREDILVEALGVLPNLTALRFRTSSIVNNTLLTILPDHLEFFETFNCSSLQSPALNSFLASKGRALRRLILDHNHSLNLSFLEKLAINCPNLEFLKMDLRYFNTFFTVRDYEPKYDSLFHDKEVPTWPPRLQSLELFHLRKWSLVTAEAFFTSLTNAAESLADLRRLKIKASIDESGWRDRIVFRDRWTQTLQDVFRRRSAPPNPHLRSIAAYKAFKGNQQDANSSIPRIGHPNGFNKSKMTARPFPVHEDDIRPTRIEVLQANAKNDASDSDTPLIKAHKGPKNQNDVDASPSRLRRSTRARLSREDVYTQPETSSNHLKTQLRRRRRRGSDESSSEDSAIDDDDRDDIVQPQSPSVEAPHYVQGMCDVVDVLIDNLRPTEEQLNEDDFLDSEVSGDEDWNGDDDMPVDGGYAW